MIPARLILEDGSVYEGDSFGSSADSIGEVVFNTSLTGYQEIATDLQSVPTAQINPQAILEVYAADNGSWTLIVTDVNGRSCVILAGKSWETLPALPMPKA